MLSCYSRSRHRHLPFTPHRPEQPARLQTAPSRGELLGGSLTRVLPQSISTDTQNKPQIKCLRQCVPSLTLGAVTVLPMRWVFAWAGTRSLRSAALVSGISWLYFCSVGGKETMSSIIIYANGLTIDSYWAVNPDGVSPFVPSLSTLASLPSAGGSPPTPPVPAPGPCPAPGTLCCCLLGIRAWLSVKLLQTVMIVAFAVKIKMNWMKSLMSATATYSVMWRVELHVIHFLLLAICKCSVMAPTRGS